MQTGLECIEKIKSAINSMEIHGINNAICLIYVNNELDDLIKVFNELEANKSDDAKGE